MTVLAGTIDHLMSNVLEAASEYDDAEHALSRAHQSGSWDKEATTAKRKAAELAIAIDGLSDRAHRELGIPIDEVRSAVSDLCFWPGSQSMRPSAFERVHGVADAYKHEVLNRPKHVINSFEDVLVVGLGYGLDGYGVGKFGGIEVLVREKSGTKLKFLGDVPTVIGAWFRYLEIKGAVLPHGPVVVCGIAIRP